LKVAPCGHTGAMTDVPPRSGDQPPDPGYQPPGPGYQPPDAGYQQPAPSYAPPRLKVTPGRIWYLVPAALFLAGIAWLIYGVVSLVGTVNDLQRVSLPGAGTVNLTSAGGYTIYYEGPGARSGSIPPFRIHITPVSPGAAVSSLTQYGSAVTYHIGSHEGHAVLTLHVRSPGRFAVTATGAPATGADLAFGGSVGRRIVGVLLPAIPLIILGALGALALLIVRIVRRRSLRNRYAQGGYVQGGTVS
jgi:hypothetical protein